MKLRQLITLFLLCLIWRSHAQKNPLSKIDSSNIVYDSILKDELDSYTKKINIKKGKYTQSSILDNELVKAQNTILFSSNEEAQGPSIAYTQAEDKSAIAAAALFQINNFNYLKAGIKTASNGQGSYFIFSEKNSWRSVQSASLAYLTLLKGSRYGKYSQPVLDKVNRKRRIYADSIFRDKKIKFSSFDKTQAQKEIQYLDTLSSLLMVYALDTSLQKKYFKKSTSLQGITSNTKKDSIYQYWIKRIEKKGVNHLRDSIQSHIKFYDEYHTNTVNKQVKNIQKELGFFDLKHHKLFGYKIRWFEFNANFSSVNYSLENDSILERIDQEPLSNHFNASLDLSFNVSRDKSGYKNGAISYWKFGIRSKIISLLDAEYLNGEKLYYDITDPKVSIINKKGEVRSNLENNSKSKFVIEPYMYGAYFWGKSKVIGFNWSVSGRYSLDDQNYQDNYTILAGPIFRVKGKEDFSKATFGFDLGYKNTLWDDNTNFLFLVKVGLPFNAVIKKKSE